MAGVKKILQNSCLIFAVCLICCTIKVQAKYFKTPYLLEMAKSDATLCNQLHCWSKGF